jgi:hypothetical protein
MGILLSSLLSVCAATSQSSMGKEACQKATEAGVNQLGIQQTMDSFEERTVHQIEMDAEKAIGKDGMYAVGGTYFLVRTIQTKSLILGIPTMGLCDSVKTDIGPKQSVLRFEWKF